MEKVKVNERESEDEWEGGGKMWKWREGRVHTRRGDGGGVERQ